MAFGFRHWGARDLLAAWSIYWIGLAAVAARTLIRLYVFASGAPKGRSTVTLAIGDGRIKLVGLLDGHSVLGGSIGIITLTLLIAGPPLALWALWLIRRPRRDALAVEERAPLLPAQRWTPTHYHETLRRDDLREREEP